MYMFKTFVSLLSGHASKDQFHYYRYWENRGGCIASLKFIQWFFLQARYVQSL
jgi:hypothetical protein